MLAIIPRPGCSNPLSALIRQLATAPIRHLAILAALPLLLAACNRTKDDLPGQYTVNGRLTFVDTLTVGAIPTPLANRQVDIANSPSDTLNYLFLAVTDSLGYFSFTGLKQGRRYDVFYHDTLNGTTILAFRSGIPGGDDTVLLQATPDYTDQSILHFLVTDTLNDPVGGVALCVFSSKVLFENDTCEGSAYQATTDANGRASVFNVAPGTYYIRATATFDSVLYSGTQSVAVKTTGVIPVAIGLSQMIQFGTLNLHIVDINNQPVLAATVYIFDNLQFFQNSISPSSSSVSAGAIETLTSDAFGNASVGGLHYETYYISAYITVGATMLKGYSSPVPISQPGANAVTIQVQ